MRAVRRTEAGVTLVELLVTVVIMSLIMGGLAASFVTAFRSTAPNTVRIRASNDAQIIAGFLVRDAQSAGGTDPATGTIDNNIGVRKDDAAGCGTATSLKLRFSWIDHLTTTSSDTHVANYYYDSSTKELVRTSCTNGGSPASLTLASNIADVATTCIPECDAVHPLPDTVSITVTTTTPVGSSSPYIYTLSASLRPENQVVPTTGNNVPIPLLVLGGLGCVSNTTGFDVGGNASVNIYGQVDIDTAGLPGCPAMFKHGSVDYISGSISILKPGTCTGCAVGSTSQYSTRFGDPYYAKLHPLAAQCGSGSNPAPGPGGYQPPAPGQPLVFPNAVSLNTASFAAGGTYVFCNGLNANSGSDITTAPGVTFYIVDGGFSLQAHASANIKGLVYAPTSVVDAHGGVAFTATSIAVGAFVVQGQDPVITLGTKPATSIQITGPASLPSWTANRTYPSTTVTAIGGGGLYSWSAVGLPAGLVIDSSSGLIHGTPTTAGSTTVGVSVVDELGDLTTKYFPVTIGGPPTISGPADLTDWTINRDYPGTAMIATGGTTPYAWSATGLPTGLSLNATTGVVTGTPSATATFTPKITLTDATGATATKNYSIVINSPPSITGPATLPNWSVGATYAAQTMTATNGTQPYTWAASGLPTGLVINAASGVITGTPNTVGTFSVSVTLTDKAGASATRNYSVTINPGPGISNTSIPSAEQGVPYNFTLTPTGGGTPPYTWSITSGPAWLSIGASTATLSGTPGPIATTNVTVRITDSAGANASTTYALTVHAPLLISGPPSLKNWTINRDYPGTAIIVANGVAPYTWSATGLPAGLTIKANTGVISGTPSATGTSTITVTVGDAAGGTDTQSYTVTINPTPSITTPSLPASQQGVAYSTTLAAAQGTLPYNWAASGLPTGLSMNAATGVLSGTPKLSGTFSVTITVTDVAGASASTIFTLGSTPAPPASITSVTLANGAGNTAGQIQQDDTITVVFSDPMSVSSFCSTWSNDANNQTLSNNNDVSVTVTDGTGVTSDALSVTSGTCTFNFGSIDLGSTAYVSGGNATFSGKNGKKSTIDWNAASHTLTILLGANVGPGTVATVASSTATYTAVGITDVWGNAVSNSPFIVPNGPQF